MSEKKYCGNARVITTQFGELTKVSFSASDLETLKSCLDNGWVNAVIKEKKNKVEGKPTHYLEIDTWKPTNGEGERLKQPHMEAAAKTTVSDDDSSLPF